MDLSVIKQKLSDVKYKPKKNEKIDYTKVFWKPKVGTHIIRIVPSVLDKRNPFKEVYLHYGLSKFPIFALTNWGEPDPIVDFTKELKKSKEKENWQLASKLSPKMRVFIPVIVRGEEDKGTRLWEVGKGIYETLLGIANDEDYGDYTDILEGRDFTIDASESEFAGRKGVSCAVRIKPKTTPITTDKALLEKILTDQPNILEINSKYKYTYEKLKEVLEKWLNPEDADSEATVSVSVDDGPSVIHEDEPETQDEISDDINGPQSDYIKNSPLAAAPVEKEKGKVKSTKKFDNLFKD